ncbi:30S ribosomal protein S20 [Salinispira pacifica]
MQNKSVRSEVRTSIRKFREAVSANNKSDAEKVFLATQKLIDGAVTKGVYHKNTASRTKSRMAHALSKMGAS